MATSQYDGIEVRGTKGSGKGRALHATKTFAPGSLIALFDKPLVAIPAGPRAKDICNGCLKPRLPVKACTGCRAVAYCGAKCQKAHWTAVHKTECKAFKRVRAKVQKDWLPTPVRVALQLLLRSEDRAVPEAVSRLEGNVADFKARKGVWSDLEMQALAAVTYAGLKTDDEHLALAMELLCKIQTNSFDLSDPDAGMSGTFLDATLAMVNHSCVPNAIVKFAGNKAYLRAEAEVQSGDEIMIAYIGKHILPTEQSLQTLDLYHFTCVCPRCKDDLNVYEVCQTSSLVPLNAFSFVPDLQQLREPPIDSKLSKDPSFRAQIESIYKACAPETMVAPENLLATLQMQWQHCEPLIRAKMWAVEPLSFVLHRGITYYAQQQNFLHALVVACFVVVNCEPFSHVAPFKQWRLEGLLIIARLMVNTAVPSEQGFKAVHPGIVSVLEKADEGTVYEALVLMVAHYAPLGHSDEWDALASVKEMLDDVNSLDSRKEASFILHEWVKRPDDPVTRRFFRERALDPVVKLADCAIDVLRADLDPQSQVVRRA